ncbi:unnamed protein product [Bemisia tabaci]|uniref:AAA-ATPase-like domain-containing protein n=1 Tax=Bemisia tabaci TaxID=7038 RepID=A0A9P0A3W9_BEMTA|nr:unnamed protein product [Bemisia tabaci]
MKRNDFEELVLNKTYIDKTLFCKLFLESDVMMYITAPSGFGKSCNLMMLKTFLSLPVNENGFRIDKRATQEFKLFSELPLAIFNESSLFNENFGEYPVLYFQFHKLILGNTSEDFISSFREVISETYDEHNYLLKSSKLLKSDKEHFNRLRTKSKEEHPSLLSASGKTLPYLLSTHFNRKCVILIDDFDSLLPQILTNNYIENRDVSDILGFLRSFLASTVSSNQFVIKVLMTGCVRFLPPETAMDATEIQTVSYSHDGDIASFFGFTEDEVTKMSKLFGREKEVEAVKEWYCCYTADQSKLKIYNMHSISRYFQSKRLAVHWSDSGRVAQLRHIFDYHYLGHIIDDSLLYNRISIALLNEMCRFNTGNVIQLKNTIKHKIVYDLREIHKNLFLKYIEDHGYLAMFKVSAAGYIYGRIPNREVKERLEHFIYTTSYYKLKFDIPLRLIKLYIKSLVNLNENLIVYTYFAKLVEMIYSYLSGPVGEEEVLRILFTFARDSLRFEAVHTGLILKSGRKVHLVVITKSKKNVGRTGIIVELNYKKESAREALSRIITGRYCDVFENEFKNFDVKTKILVGLQLSKENKCSICFLCNSTNILNAKSENIKLKLPKF